MLQSCRKTREHNQHMHSCFFHRDEAPGKSQDFRDIFPCGDIKSKRLMSKLKTKSSPSFSEELTVFGIGIEFFLKSLVIGEAKLINASCVLYTIV
jgi:hypothetical protein